MTRFFGMEVQTADTLPSGVGFLVCPEEPEKSVLIKAATDRPSYWECKCGWRVNDVAYMSILVDAPCLRCEARYSTFNSRGRPKTR